MKPLSITALLLLMFISTGADAQFSGAKHSPTDSLTSYAQTLHIKDNLFSKSGNDSPNSYSKQQPSGSSVSSKKDTRSQYPLLLRNAFFEVNVGYINYPFSDIHMLPGYSAEEIWVPHAAPRIIPIGYNINEYFAVQVSYLRPVLWVRYRNVNGDSGNHPVFMNVGGFTLKAKYPVLNKLYIYGEAGLGVITRKGFNSSTPPHPLVMDDANYGTWLFGSGIKYKPGRKWDLQLSMAYSPGNKKNNQPHTFFTGAGFAFNMYKLDDETVERNASSDKVFPKNMIQIGYTTNALGYGVNNFFSQGAIPVFWGGDAEIAQGFTLHYQRNVFHGYKYFSLDWGVSFSYNVSNVYKHKFWTVSVFPVFRWTLIHTDPVAFYLNYSLAGPSYISGENIDETPSGPHFTFQDFMGMGFYFGPGRRLNFEARIAHYSNGNLFPDNMGVKIPLTFNAGYTF